MKHSEVKKQTVKMNRVKIAGEGHIENVKETLTNRLQPSYYGLRNEIEFEVNGDQLQASAEKLTMFFFDEREAKQFELMSETCITKRDEAVNRLRAELTGFRYVTTLELGQLGHTEAVNIEFRAGGDYVCTNVESNKVTYGGQLRASDFSEEGFTTQMLNGVDLIYTRA